MLTTRCETVALLLLTSLAMGAQAMPAVGRAPPLPAVQQSRPDSFSIAYSQYLWPAVNGLATVYYTIDSASDPNAASKINTALSTFNTDFQGVIQWVPWNSTLSSYYVDIDLNAANLNGVCEVGAEGFQDVAAQSMGGSTNCTIGTILHEMGHIVGLWHEHTRPDRNTYVTVNYSNAIKGSWTTDFQVRTDDQRIMTAYDYASVMQYIPFAFTRNGGPTLESIPAGIPLAGYAGVPAQAGAGGTPAVPSFDYSAGDKETIRRLYGAAPTTVTVTSNPVGLSVIVDGVTVTTPQNYAWALYSTHTLDVSSEVQAVSGAVLNSANPTAAATYYYTYGRWSDSTTQSHSITVTPGTGSPAFPSTTPAVATYSANFIQLVPYTAAIYPAGSGQIAVTPQPESYTGVSGQFFVAREKATLTATAGSGWNFYEINNAPFYLPGGLGANPKTFYVPDSGNPVDSTVEFSNTPIYTVDVRPTGFSSNAYAYVDTTTIRTPTPKNFSSSYDSSWTSGSSHTLGVDNEESPYSVNSRLNFSTWSDGGKISHAIILPAAAAQYIAKVIPEFAPATNFGYPPCGGSATLSPASPTDDGFYPSGQQLSFDASPDATWTFGGWTYDLTGTARSTTLTASDETLVFANFNTTAAPLTLTGLSPSAAASGRTAFTLTLIGTGFTAGSYVSVNGQYRTVTFVNAQKLTVPMTTADVASPTAYQVFVENFPSGWDGCANFGYETFVVNGKGTPAAKPVFSPAAGTYGAAQSVTITDAIADASIFYTTDGSGPTSASTPYAGAITVSSSQTLKAIATATGYKPSPVAIALYTIKIAAAAKPTFSPAAGTYSSGRSVSLKDATAGSTLYYTTDGTTPTTASPVYGGPITVAGSETLKAIAVAAGYSQSAVASAVYTID